MAQTGIKSITLEPATKFEQVPWPPYKIENEGEEFEFYYRRGNTYFFRSDNGAMKISITADYDFKFERGKKYLLIFDS